MSIFLLATHHDHGNHQTYRKVHVHQNAILEWNEYYIKKLISESTSK